MHLSDEEIIINVQSPYFSESTKKRKILAKKIKKSKQDLKINNI
jgi:hypothetical protein